MSPRQLRAERRLPGQRAADRRGLEKQLDRLNNPAESHQFQRELFGTIDDRQRGRRNRVDIGRIDRDAGDFLVAVRGEILVRTPDAAAVRDVLGRGYREQPVRELDGRALRFATTGATLQETRDAVAGLRQAGVQATVNYVLPLGYIAKGEGGFENTTVVHDTFEPGPEGTGVRVAVVDTGVAAKRRADGWLVGVPRGLGTVDPLYQDGQGDLLDFAAGHGTFVAGVIAQVAPGADLRCFAAVQSNGIGSEVAVAGAVLRAARSGARVVNLSLGTETENDEEPVGLAVALEMIKEELGEHAPVLVAAAGNSASDRKTWPAAFDDVVGVASLAADGSGSGWSNRGAWVTCSTVGEGVVSPYVEGVEDEAVDKEDPDVFEVDAWAMGTGTSFAAPQVAGRLAAVLSQDPSLTRQAALDLVLDGSSDLTASGFGHAIRVLEGT